MLSDPDKKILVTGGAGFIGSHVCERLLDIGFRVVCVDNFNDFYDPAVKAGNLQAIQTRSDRENFINYVQDIRNYSEILKVFEKEKPDAVIHLAAMAGVRPSIENPALYSDVNIMGTQSILDACAQTGVRSLLFASSSSVYGNNKKVPFSETDQVDFPISPYAATKKAGELLCHSYAHLYEMSIDCLRFFTVYGPRQRPDLAIHKFSKCLLEEKEIPFYGDGMTARDYTYIDDIVYGIIMALRLNLSRKGKSYEMINLGGSRTVTLKEMVEILERVFQKKAKLKRLPSQAGDVELTYADISKAKNLLQYAPSVSFKQGIEKFASWMLRSRPEVEITS